MKNKMPLERKVGFSILVGLVFFLGSGALLVWYFLTRDFAP